MASADRRLPLGPGPTPAPQPDVPPDPPQRDPLQEPVPHQPNVQQDQPQETPQAQATPPHQPQTAPPQMYPPPGPHFQQAPQQAPPPQSYAQAPPGPQFHPGSHQTPPQPFHAPAFQSAYGMQPRPQPSVPFPNQSAPPPPVARPPLQHAAELNLDGFLNSITAAQYLQLQDHFTRNNDGRSPLSPHPHANGHPPRQSLKPERVGFFDPSRDDPKSIGFVADGKLSVYTNVYNFTQRLQQMARTFGDEAVLEIWTQCLLGTAQQWLTVLLSEDDRIRLENGTVDDVVHALQIRFKEDRAQAMAYIRSHYFTIKNVLDGDDILVYINTMIAKAKACGFDTYGQLLTAYENMDGHLQPVIPKPTPDQSLDEFVYQVNAAASVVDRVAQQLRFDRRITEARFERALTGRPGQRPPADGRPQGTAQRPNQGKGTDNNKPTYNSGRPTTGQRNNRTPYRNNFNKTHQSPAQPAYNVDIESDNVTAEDVPANDENLDQSDYDDGQEADADEMDVDDAGYLGTFIDTQEECRRCHSVFPSRNKLHDHLRREHGLLQPKN